MVDNSGKNGCKREVAGGVLVAVVTGFLFFFGGVSDEGESWLEVGLKEGL